MKHSSRRNRWTGRLSVLSLSAFLSAIAFIAIFTTVEAGNVTPWRSPFLLSSFSVNIPSAQAQPAPLRRIDPYRLATLVYEQVPTLPLENQYISSQTGQVVTDNTLVSRIIRYHLYIKDRRTNFRFDWKLTMADYFGAFDRISANDYADYGLRENPAVADIEVVKSLSQEERDRLTNTLYEVFTAPANSAHSSAPSTTN